MLFRIKNSLWGTLVLTLVLFISAVILYTGLHIPDVAWGNDTIKNIILSLVVLLIGDGVVQGGLRMFYGPQFQETFNTFLSEVVVGEWEVVIIVGLTAAMEEMFFRGALGGAMIGLLHWAPALVVIITSFIFSFSHYYKRPGLNMWLMTSIWEGLALGITYALTGSVITIMIVHAIHDIINGGVAIILVDRIKAAKATHTK